jgi:hypothetical protein
MNCDVTKVMVLCFGFWSKSWIQGFEKFAVDVMVFACEDVVRMSEGFGHVSCSCMTAVRLYA